MLNFFRERTKTFIWIIIVAFIGMMVLVWGLNITQKRKAKDYAIKVNNLKITTDEFNNAYANYTRQIQSAPKNEQERLYAEARERVANQLIEQKIIELTAKKYKIIATPDEILSRIREYDEFKTNGYFDPAKFNSYRRSPYFKLQWPYIWKSEKDGLIKSKVQNIIYIGAQISDLDLKYKYFYLYGKHNADILKINLAKRAREIKTPPSSVLKKYYKEHLEKWRIPEKRKIEYLSFYYPDYYDSVTITDEEINEYFNKNRDKYAEISEVKARHILIKVPQNASKKVEKQAKEKIEHIYNMLKQGADFIELAKKYSEDGTAFSGGDLGWFPRGKMVPEFEKVAFSTEPGKFSKPFKTMFGYHIVLVEDWKKGDIPPMEQLRPKIYNELRDLKAKEYSWQDANNVLSQIISDTDFDTVATFYKKNYYVSPYFDKNTDTLPILGKNLRFIISATFSLDKGAVYYDVVPADSSFNIIRLKDIKDSYIPKFYKVRKKVLKDYKISRVKKKYTRLVRRYKDDWIKENRRFINFLSRYNFKLDNADFIRARRNYEYPLDLQKTIVESKIDSIIDTPIENDNYIYFAKKIKITYDENELESDKFGFYHAYIYQKGNDLYQLWLKEEKKKAKIDYTIFIKQEITEDTAVLEEDTNETSVP